MVTGLARSFGSGRVCVCVLFPSAVRQGDMVGSTGKLASSSDLDRSLTFNDVAGVDKAKAQVQVIFIF